MDYLSRNKTGGGVRVYSRINNNAGARWNKLTGRLMARLLARLIHHDNLVHLFSSMPVPGCLIDDELPVDG